MRVAVICEFSGIVRDAFNKYGHCAISFDLLPSELPGNHVQIDINTLPVDYWKQFDLAICHPPCTHLAVSGARWFKYKQKEQVEALDFVRYLMSLPIHRIALENPISVIAKQICRPNQIIQPWQFGHGENKATCLWLKNLRRLIPTDIVKGREARVHKMPPSENRWKDRSRTYRGIAEAMAKQWSNIEEEQLCLNFG